ncbi:MAG: LemA family protein [Methanomassiliicoccales archaeon PtaU1.Bin124]|nr:MAG: LemA family protein [Methanomassiliicoccales archaeon PtaU1.Bin124]
MANPLSNRRILIMVVVIAVVVIMLLWVVLAYNGVVGKDQDVKSSAAQIKNRYTTKTQILSELLPVVQSYAIYESSLFSNLTSLQTQWQQALNTGASDTKLINISSQIDTNFVLVLSTWTNYPELKNNQIVSQYMGEIVDLNEQLSYSRGNYNEKVNDYNTAIKSFPMMMFSGAFGFQDHPYWGTEDRPVTTL